MLVTLSAFRYCIDIAMLTARMRATARVALPSCMPGQPALL
jgi:hypothetical protein